MFVRVLVLIGLRRGCTYVPTQVPKHRRAEWQDAMTSPPEIRPWQLVACAWLVVIIIRAVIALAREAVTSAVRHGCCGHAALPWGPNWATDVVDVVAAVVVVVDVCWGRRRGPRLGKYGHE